MTSLTPSELTLLRTRPQETTLWLSIYKPPTMLACRVNDVSIAKGEQHITYDGVTAGSFLLVEAGMTMYVGTTAGARDVGRIRVKSITSSVITIAENWDINWQDNLYLTIVKFFEIDTVYPRITSTGTSTYWYKDYDVEYTNQNSSLGSVICMGPHHAAFLEGGSCNVYYSASGTYNFKGENLNYHWFFQGATTTGSSAHTPGNITYDTPGHYTTRLIVSGTSAGAVDISYRHISIYDRPESGTFNPILNWEFFSLDGTRDQGGYQARITVRDNIEDVVEGALVVIFADDKYGDTKQSIGGNAINRQTIVFVGYILEGTISYDYQESSAEFSVGSPTEIMKLSEGFGVALNTSTDPEGQAASDDDIPSAWVLMLDMDCKRAIYHYLRWHSTALLTNDFEFRGTDQFIQYFDSDRETMYDAINNLMMGTLYGNVICDRQGKIWSEISVAATNNATGTFPTILDLDNQDWIGKPSIEESFNRKVGYIEMGGIQFIPSSGTSSAYLCGVPGENPSYRGAMQKVEGLALSGQDMLNTLAGNVFAYMNSKYAHLALELSGNYRHIDIVPQEIINVSLKAEDTPKRIVWNKKAFHPTDISWTYDSSQGTFLPNIVLHEITQGFAATTIVIPPIPPVTDPGGGGFDIPPIIIPPFVGFIYIYHNGTFVAVVSGLNFVDTSGGGCG